MAHEVMIPLSFRKRFHKLWMIPGKPGVVLTGRGAETVLHPWAVEVNVTEDCSHEQRRMIVFLLTRDL